MTLHSDSKDTPPHWDAKLYKKNSVKLQQNTAFEFLSTIYIDKSHKVLDVGSGDGKISKRLAELVAEGSVNAFDLSPDMINLAKECYRDIDNLNFSVENAEAFDLGDDHDWVFSFFCLQWVRDKAKSFKSISSALKKGGNVGLIMTDRNQTLKLVREELYKENVFKNYFDGYSDDTAYIDDSNYIAYAEGAGLTDINYKEYIKTIEYDSKYELFKFIYMVTPAIKRLPTNELKDEFITKLSDRYINKINLSLNTIDTHKYFISYTIKILTAKKD